MLSLLSYFCIIFCILFLEGFQERESKYPEWFVNPPTSEDNLFSVGYSRRFYESTTSFQLARDSGNVQLAIHYSSLYRFKREMVNMEWGELVDNEIRRDEIPLSVIDATIIDSILTDKLAIMLVASNPAPMLDASLMIEFSSEPPNWINNPPRPTIFIYSVGTAPIYVDESNSWLEAEKNARFSLAAEVKLEIQSMTMVYNEIETRTTRISSEVRLDHIEVIDRWRDSRNCYVLSRVAISNTSTEINE